MPDFEIVVYDDGSSDGTLRTADDYAARDARVRVVRGNHAGIAGARNNGFAATDPRSEFVTFFDHDDVWEKDALTELLKALQLHPECPAAHGVAQCIDSDGVQFPHDDHAQNVRARRAVVGNRIVPIPRSAPTSFGTVLVRNYITTPGTSLVRRSALQAIGGFEPSAVPCDDWDMNLRLSRLGDFAFVDKILLNWRRHEQATSNLSKRWRVGYMVTRRRSVSAPENTSAQRNAALVALRHEVVGLQREAAMEMLHGGVRTALKKLARSLLLGSIYVGGWVPMKA
jgi:glycosyltransferase involved in cell wall biosynthesis